MYFAYSEFVDNNRKRRVLSSNTCIASAHEQKARVTLLATQASQQAHELLRHENHSKHTYSTYYTHTHTHLAASNTANRPNSAQTPGRQRTVDVPSVANSAT